LIRDVSSYHDNSINTHINHDTSYPTINIAGFNCHGLLYKVNSLLLSASLPHNAWHIICLQETHEAPYFNQQNLLLRHGWKYYCSIYDSNHDDDTLLHPRRGTAIYLSEVLTQQWNIIHHNTDTDLITWVTLRNKHRRLHVFSVYALDTSKPYEDRQQAYSMLTRILTDIDESDDICIQGDFNASILAPNINTPMLDDFIEQHNLHIMPNDLPTYIGAISTTTIDHFLLSPSLLPYITEHYVDVSSPTLTHPPSDHCVVSIRVYATATPPPSLDIIIPAPPPRAAAKKYNVHQFKDADVATQYVDAIADAYKGQWHSKYTKLDNPPCDNMKDTVEQMTAQLRSIIHTSATTTVGYIHQPTHSHTQPLPVSLVNTVNRQYHRHQKNKSPLSYSRYMAAQDRLTAYMQQMTDSRYYNLMNDISDAVSTFQHDSSVWWKLIERITRPAAQQHMTMQQIQKKVNAMKQHQQQLLGPHTTLDAQFDNEWFTHVNEYTINEYPALSLQSTHIMVSRITLAEIQAATKQLQNGKHPGHDNILNEMMKYGGEALQHMLLQLFNEYMHHQYTPTSLWHAQIMMLAKNNGDANDLNNYRGISLTSSISKLYEAVLYHRLQLQVGPMLHIQQAGFTQQRGCPENIFTLTECASFRYYHQNKSTYILFCDLAKAYDSVWRNGLYYKLIHEYSIPHHFVNIILQIYSSVQCCILYHGIKSTTFTAYKGLLQGSVLSPLLFNIYINELVGILHTNLTGVMYGYTCKWSDRHDNDIDIPPHKVTSTFYADDFSTINADTKGVAHSIKLIYAYCKKWRLTLNCNKGKTEVLVMYCMPSDEKCQQWETPNSDIIHRTKRYTYLGVQLNEYADATPYIEKRLRASHNAMGKLYSTHVLGSNTSLQCRVTLYRSIILPILNYCSEVMTYGSTTSFEKLSARIDKRHHTYVKQLLHCRNKSAPIDWFLAETGLQPVVYYKAIQMFSFYARMSLAKKEIPAHQIYDRMFVMRHQAQQGHHNNCKDPYQSWYHKHLEDLANRFNVKLEANDMTWITSMKKIVNQHWDTTWKDSMQKHDATWSNIYIILKQQPDLEPYMKSLVHPVATALHKLRSSHFPFQRHVGRIDNTDTTCKLCDAAEEDIAHFLLHCTSYRHRRALRKQIDHVKQHYNVQYQREVDNYFNNDLPDTQQCAHLLSRTLPPPSTPLLQRDRWQEMWYTIFHKLDKHIHILVTQREAMLLLDTHNQLQQAIRHNRQ
jgi:hypothetical protein